MQCNHCLVEFHDKANTTIVGKDTNGHWLISAYGCPACQRVNLFLVNGTYSWSMPGEGALTSVDSVRLIHPKGSGHPPCPPEVPEAICEDYSEACLTIADSPKASAALSRRCLQFVLRDAAKVKPGNLANEIQEVLDKGHLPTHLADSIDAVRNVGNFSAHPMKSQVTGEILPVEPEEAEWNLEVLEGLFDYYYVQPTITAKRRAALDAKLAEAGKPAMK